jgi:hypothetical protein
MNRQNSDFLAHLLLLQRSLVVKSGVSPSGSRSLSRSHSLSCGDSTTGLWPQCWDQVLPHHNYQSTDLCTNVMFTMTWSFIWGAWTLECSAERLHVPPAFTLMWVPDFVTCSAEESTPASLPYYPRIHRTYLIIVVLPNPDSFLIIRGGGWF